MSAMMMAARRIDGKVSDTRPVRFTVAVVWARPVRNSGIVERVLFRVRSDRPAFRILAGPVLSMLVGVGCSMPPPLGSGRDDLDPGVRPGDGPPPVTVRAGDLSFDLRAWTYCFGNTCADGFPPPNPPDLGAAPRVEVEFPLEDWTFEAIFVPVGDDCPRRHSVPVEQTDDHTYVVEPAGRADTYDVTLFGRGDGDLFVTFRWTTPFNGPMPVPAARLAVLADHDGAVDSYGVELEVSDLAATPEVATAEVTVTAANGGR